MTDLANSVERASSKDNDEFTLDSILVRIGQFGRFQLIVFSLICVPMLYNAIYSVMFVFTASNVVHRCNIIGCDSPTSQYDESWTDFTIPTKGKELERCYHYVNISSVSDPLPTCSAQNFDPINTEKCSTDNLIFRDKEITISNDFGIYCDDVWKLALVGTINNVGQFVGIPLGGFISDRYGRRSAIALGGFCAAIFGIISSFSPNYIFFVVFEFLSNVSSSTLYPTGFILGIELVGPKRRVIACSVIAMFFPIGEILLALVSKYYQNWRVLLRIFCIPGLIHLAFFWILPESVRWLLSLQLEERAKAVLQRAAAVNKRKLSDHSLERLVLANRDKLQQANETKFPIKEAFQKFPWRIANCSFCWIVNALVYYGITLNAVLLVGDKYNNFMFIALVEIPGFFLPFVIINRLGRRYSLFLLLLISGLCCLATVFTTDDQNVLVLILFLIGKLAITASFQVLYIFTSEIFPTKLRSSLLSFCSMTGRIGSMIAPQTPLLATYFEPAPAVIFASAAIISACLSLLFPETTNLILPSTIKDAGDIGDKKKKNAQ